MGLIEQLAEALAEGDRHRQALNRVEFHKAPTGYMVAVLWAREKSCRVRVAELKRAGPKSEAYWEALEYLRRLGRALAYCQWREQRGPGGPHQNARPS